MNVTACHPVTRHCLSIELSPFMAKSSHQYAVPSNQAKTLTLVATCVGYFMVILDTTVVNVALPKIQTTLSANVSGLQWVVDAYILIFASLLLTAGTLGDRLGQKRIFLAGLLLFTIASTLCGAATSLETLIAARLFQGLSCT